MTARKILPLSLALAAWALFHPGCVTQGSVRGENQSRTFLRSSEICTYHLTIFEALPPEKSRGLVLALCGTGVSLEGCLQTWKAEADRKKIMVLVPNRKELSRTGEGTFDEKLIRLMRQVMLEFSINPEKTYLIGASAGAIVARPLFMKYPSFWKAVVLLNSPAGEPWPTDAAKNPLPPILFVHGRKDSQFPFDQIARRIEVLRRQGYQVDLLDDATAGHEYRSSWGPKIFDWLNRNSEPHRTYS